MFTPYRSNIQTTGYEPKLSEAGHATHRRHEPKVLDSTLEGIPRMKSSDPAERERFRERFISVVRVIGGQWMLLNERKINPELGGQAGQLGPERLAAQGLFTPRRAFASERTRDPAEGKTRLEAVLEEESGDRKSVV